VTGPESGTGTQQGEHEDFKQVMWRKRILFSIWDHLRFDPFFRLVTSAVILIYVRLFRPHDTPRLIRSAHLAVRAARICPSPAILRRLENSLRSSIDRLEPTGSDWDLISADSANAEVYKGIILKRPVGPNEKGVLLISFEGQWLRLFRHGDVERIARDYHLVLAPSWSPPHDLPMQLAAKKWPGTLYTLMSNFNDTDAFRRLAPNTEPIPLLASSWVHPQVFDVSDSVAKEYDIVVLANFAAYKRHFLLFRALRDMPPHTSALLLGRAIDGRSAETIMSEARAYGVADKVTIKEGLPDAEMVRAMRSARVSLMLSGTEGSCVAVVETLFADIAVGMFSDAIIGSKAYINDQTGTLLQSRHLGRQLSQFIERHESFSPRRWVIDNDVSCYGSSRILNDALRKSVTARGEQWTTDIAVHHWRPNPSYVNEEDVAKFADLYADFLSKYKCGMLRRSTDGAPMNSVE